MCRADFADGGYCTIDFADASGAVIPFHLSLRLAEQVAVINRKDRSGWRRERHIPVTLHGAQGCAVQIRFTRFYADVTLDGTHLGRFGRWPAVHWSAGASTGVSTGVSNGAGMRQRVWRGVGRLSDIACVIPWGGVDPATIRLDCPALVVSDGGGERAITPGWEIGWEIAVPVQPEGSTPPGAPGPRACLTDQLGLRVAGFSAPDEVFLHMDGLADPVPYLSHPHPYLRRGPKGLIADERPAALLPGRIWCPPQNVPNMAQNGKNGAGERADAPAIPDCVTGQIRDRHGRGLGRVRLTRDALLAHITALTRCGPLGSFSPRPDRHIWIGTSDPLAVLQVIEHVHHARLWPALDPAAQQAIAAAAAAFGLTALLEGAAGASVSSPLPGATAPPFDLRPPQISANDRVYQTFVATLRARTQDRDEAPRKAARHRADPAPMALLRDLLRDTPLSLSERRALFISLSDWFCLNANPLELTALARSVCIAPADLIAADLTAADLTVADLNAAGPALQMNGLHKGRSETDNPATHGPQEIALRNAALARIWPLESVWSRTAMIPFLYTAQRWDDLRDLLWSLAAPQQGWVLTAPVGWLIREVLHNPPVALDEKHREELIYGFLGILDKWAPDYWSRTACQSMTEAAASLIAHHDSFAQYLRIAVIWTVLRAYGLSPGFWQAMSAGHIGGHVGRQTALPAPILRARASFARLAALIGAAPDGSASDGSASAGSVSGADDTALVTQRQIAQCLAQFRQWGCVDVTRFERDLLGPARAALPTGQAPQLADLTDADPATDGAGALIDEAALRWLAYPHARRPAKQPEGQDCVPADVVRLATRALPRHWAGIPAHPFARLMRQTGSQAAALCQHLIKQAEGSEVEGSQVQGSEAMARLRALLPALQTLDTARNGHLGQAVMLSILTACLRAPSLPPTDTPITDTPTTDRPITNTPTANTGTAAAIAHAALTWLEARRPADYHAAGLPAALATGPGPVPPGPVPLSDIPAGVRTALAACLRHAAQDPAHRPVADRLRALYAAWLPAPAPETIRALDAARADLVAQANPLFDTIVTVFSCTRYLDDRIPALRAGWLSELRALGIPYVVIVGDGDGSLRGDVLHLDAPDDYEGLPQKTLAAIRWVHDQTPFSRMLKLDDDCFLNAPAFFHGLSYLTADYYGRPLYRVRGQMDRRWHMAKSRSARGRLELDKSPEPSAYADGGSGYALSRDAMAAALRAADSPAGRALASVSFMEDKLLGDLLAGQGIWPQGDDHRVTVLRQSRPGGPLVSQWENGFLPFGGDGPDGADIRVAHLDGHTAQADVLARRDSAFPLPAKVWPSSQALRLGAGSNALDLMCPAQHLARVNAAEVAVVACMRNERSLLPAFLDHYRGLGVDGFLIADNGSDDGTLEYLLDQPDVAPFSVETDYNLSQYGVAWQQALLSNFRTNRWSLVADADELLFWRLDRGGALPDLLAGPEFSGADAARIYMLDMYPKGPLLGADFTTASPFDQAGYVDRVPFLTTSGAAGPYSDAPVYTSALRHRLLPGSRAELFVAQKIALLKYRPWMRLSAGLHFVAGTRLARRELIFAHFKYNAAFHAKAQAEVARRQHFNNAEEYRKYLALLSEGCDVIHDPAHSVPWYDCGFVRDLCAAPACPADRVPNGQSLESNA